MKNSFEQYFWEIRRELDRTSLYAGADALFGFAILLLSRSGALDHYEHALRTLSVIPVMLSLYFIWEANIKEHEIEAYKEKTKDM